ncbi:heterokaryon incompatibility protein-domain-containing protein [Rhexocercosporidium sp. MPI-PUGE-AT-0058]|nr:heterokaryon incompatibility protein-domain-containing protein [Rhexocercosporidium sp. MPI-PUGE-AT-0058]
MLVYGLDSRISAYVKPTARKEPHDIRSITLCITDTRGESTSIGDGAVETVFNRRENTCGVWAVDGQASARHISQRFASPEINTPEVFETARAWMSECLQTHNECPKHSPTSPLPTRVLDLSSITDTDMIKVHTTTASDIGAQYAALSYCWGKTPQTMLTLSTVPDYTSTGLSITSLPRTLRDAIHVTRSLAIPYLWIDSLCIIQDSTHDKAIEISAMPSIYKNAIVTISAASSADCGDGFLSARSDIAVHRDTSLILPYSMNEAKHEDMSLDEIFESAEGPQDVGAVFLSMDETMGFGLKAFSEEVISKRAWTLQESWLAPRLLVFGEGPLGWQCLREAKYFGGSKPDGVVEEFVPTDSRRKFFESALNGESGNAEAGGQKYGGNWMDPAREWRQIVSEYTRRAMTDHGDKLPALSGIAAEFRRLLGENDEYLAGLWKSTLPFSLLWHQLSASQSEVLGVYRAPSWSWASVDGDISMKIPLEMLARTELVVHDVYVDVAETLAPMGKVVGGVLELSGLMRSMSWKEVQERFVVIEDFEQGAHMYWDYIIPDNDHLNPYLRNPQRNEQYAQPGQAVNISVWPPLPFSSLPEAELQIDTAPGRSDRILKGLSERFSELGVKKRQGMEEDTFEGASDKGGTDSEETEYIFLEICRAPEPRGLVLVVAEDGNVKRIGYFFLGGRELTVEERTDGNWSAGSRDWDWNAGLETKRVSII